MRGFVRLSMSNKAVDAGDQPINRYLQTPYGGPAATKRQQSFELFARRFAAVHSRYGDQRKPYITNLAKPIARQMAPGSKVLTFFQRNAADVGIVSSVLGYAITVDAGAALANPTSDPRPWWRYGCSRGWAGANAITAHEFFDAIPDCPSCSHLRRATEHQRLRGYSIAYLS